MESKELSGSTSNKTKDSKQEIIENISAPIALMLEKGFGKKNTYSKDKTELVYKKYAAINKAFFHIKGSELCKEGSVGDITLIYFLTALGDALGGSLSGNVIAYLNTDLKKISELQFSSSILFANLALPQHLSLLDKTPLYVGTILHQIIMSNIDENTKSMLLQGLISVTPEDQLLLLLNTTDSYNFSVMELAMVQSPQLFSGLLSLYQEKAKIPFEFSKKEQKEIEGIHLSLDSLCSVHNTTVKSVNAMQYAPLNIYELIAKAVFEGNNNDNADMLLHKENFKKYIQDIYSYFPYPNDEKGIQSYNRLFNWLGLQPQRPSKPILAPSLIKLLKTDQKLFDEQREALFKQGSLNNKENMLFILKINQNYCNFYNKALRFQCLKELLANNTIKHTSQKYAIDLFNKNYINHHSICKDFKHFVETLILTTSPLDLTELMDCLKRFSIISESGFKDFDELFSFIEADFNLKEPRKFNFSEKQFLKEIAQYHTFYLEYARYKMDKIQSISELESLINGYKASCGNDPDLMAEFEEILYINVFVQNDIFNSKSFANVQKIKEAFPNFKCDFDEALLIEYIKNSNECTEAQRKEFAKILNEDLQKLFANPERCEDILKIIEKLPNEFATYTIQNEAAYLNFIQKTKQFKDLEAIKKGVLYLAKYGQTFSMKDIIAFADSAFEINLIEIIEFRLNKENYAVMHNELIGFFGLSDLALIIKNNEQRLLDYTKKNRLCTKSDVTKFKNQENRLFDYFIKNHCFTENTFAKHNKNNLIAFFKEITNYDLEDYSEFLTSTAEQKAFLLEFEQEYSQDYLNFVGKVNKTTKSVLLSNKLIDIFMASASKNEDLSKIEQLRREVFSTDNEKLKSYFVTKLSELRFKDNSTYLDKVVVDPFNVNLVTLIIKQDTPCDIEKAKQNIKDFIKFNQNLYITKDINFYLKIDSKIFSKEEKIALLKETRCYFSQRNPIVSELFDESDLLSLVKTNPEFLLNISAAITRFDEKEFQEKFLTALLEEIPTNKNVDGLFCNVKDEETRAYLHIYYGLKHETKLNPSVGVIIFERLKEVKFPEKKMCFEYLLLKNKLISKNYDLTWFVEQIIKGTEIKDFTDNQEKAFNKIAIIVDTIKFLEENGNPLINNMLLHLFRNTQWPMKLLRVDLQNTKAIISDATFTDFIKFIEHSNDINDNEKYDIIHSILIRKEGFKFDDKFLKTAPICNFIVKSYNTVQLEKNKDDFEFLDNPFAKLAEEHPVFFKEKAIHLGAYLSDTEKNTLEKLLFESDEKFQEILKNAENSKDVIVKDYALQLKIKFENKQQDYAENNNNSQNSSSSVCKASISVSAKEEKKEERPEESSKKSSPSSIISTVRSLFNKTEGKKK